MPRSLGVPPPPNARIDAQNGRCFKLQAKGLRSARACRRDSGGCRSAMVAQFQTESCLCTPNVSTCENVRSALKDGLVWSLVSDPTRVPSPGAVAGPGLKAPAPRGGGSKSSSAFPLRRGVRAWEDLGAFSR